MDEPSAASFAVTLAIRASGKRPVIWVRQDFVGLEMGEIYAPGLNELGLSPDRLILVRARDAPSVLRAGEEAARCPGTGSAGGGGGAAGGAGTSSTGISVTRSSSSTAVSPAST